MSARRRKRTAGRRAQGRERAPARGTTEPRWLTCVLDAWAEHRATQAPLERLLKRRGERLRLGPRDRGRARELGFALSRWGAAAFAALDEAQRAYGGVRAPARERDRAGVALAALAADLEPVRVELPEPLAAVLEDARDHGPGAVLGDRPRLPAWLQARLEARFAADAAAEIAALLKRAPVTLAVDPRTRAVDEVVERLAEAGISAEASPVSPTGVRAAGRVPPQLLSALGDVWPMDDGSQRVVHSLEVEPGQRVLDLCAGGGGKSRLLEALGARVVSADLDRGRLLAAPASCARVVMDGRAPPFAADAFDRVLVDAPCSGTGTLRRAPDRAHTLREDEIPPFAELQRGLLAAAAPLVRPGGRLVYATCSLLAEEDEDIVEGAAALGLAVEGAAELLTPARHGTDGFFVARFRREAR